MCFDKVDDAGHASIRDLRTRYRWKEESSPEDVRVYSIAIYPGVLRFFLQIPNIYATKDLRNELEARARENISREIKLLESNARTY
ncbi:hypothetical protein ANCCEY_10565 [Ancylostoma ceylanicum]|uniref:Uncharacterized protein n=1 Tax=Ancylostoma ceylanicum TaxID=53326 RepID=A0A0D6LRT9_9BILA|nr:hypothetical protein ANCCEY_10565 [Ancylostoma ceylanicum]